MSKLTAVQRLIAAVALIIIVVGTLYARRPPEEEIAYSPITVVLADGVTAQLAQDWKQARRPDPWNERVYCIERYQITADSAQIPSILVEAVREDVTAEATPFSIGYSCGPLPALHTHPPFECEVDEQDKLIACEPRDELIENCEPSETDVVSVKAEWHRFHGVQCAPDKFLWFVPFWQ